MKKIKVELGTVQETLLIPLYARYIEAQKQNGLINDKTSIEIVEKIDYDFSKFDADKKSALACVLRGIILDNWAKDYINKHQQGIIIDIGVGLDTRYNRIANKEIKYFELDLPDAIKLRKQVIKEGDNRQFISGSILNDEWIEKIVTTNKEKQPCFFIIEGVFQYMDEPKVKKIFKTIKDNFPRSLVAFDLISPSMIKRTKMSANSLKELKAEFTWGLLNPLDIHSWNKDYKVVDIKTFFDLSSHYLKDFTAIQRLIFKFVPYPIKMVLVEVK